MFSRREFMKNSAFAAGAAGMFDGLLASIQRAFAIEPEKGSTYLDAEHVVILMQENRSFDHIFGTLRGVRGFNDPRAITLPDGNPVWVQATESGDDGTNDLMVSDVIRTNELQAWFLAEHVVDVPAVKSDASEAAPAAKPETARAAKA